MGGLEHATPGVLALLAFAGWMLLRQLARANSGHRHFIRRIPGVDAIESAVGRCAELGRPVVFTTALTDVGPVLFACLGVLHSIAKRTAQYKLKLLVPQYSPEAMAIVEDTVREAYRAAGRANTFDPKSIVFLSSEQFAFASGYMGLVHREQAGAAFMFGVFAAEALVLAEAGQQVGARQVAASVSPEQVAFFICTCDYTLIGEELFGASAYMSREPIQVAALAAQDRVKLLFGVFVVLGVVCATAAQFHPVFREWMPHHLLVADWTVWRGWLESLVRFESLVDSSVWR
jgi:hypothetical protein